MSYVLCKNYFIDYFWQAPGDHESTGVAATNYLLPYDNKYYWFDVVNQTQPGDPDRWYIAELLYSTKFYSKYNHEYDVAPLTYTNKMGLYIWAGGHAGQNNVIQVVESAAEIPPNTDPGGVVRPGFEGQYGKASAVHYTGTQYEGSIQFRLDLTMKQPPEADAPKAIGGITIYANGGAAGDTDGLHIIFIPVHSHLNIKDIDGAWQTIDGVAGGTGAWAVARGNLLDPINLVLIDYGTTYDDTSPFMVDDDMEYFFRIQYWPENKPLKYTKSSPEPSNTPNLDRRIRIFFGDDKKRLKKVATVAAIDCDYTDAVNYIQLFVYDYYYDYAVGQEWVAYEYTWVGFDEIVVNSEWLPYDQMFVLDIDTFTPSWTKILYQKEDNELTHSYDSTEDTMPTFLPMDQLRVYSLSNLYPETKRILYMTDFLTAFADGWTQASPVGAWYEESTPITGFRDEFFDEYGNKGNDPNWTIGAGTWNTSTTSGWMQNNGAGDIYTTNDAGCDNDLYLSTSTDWAGDAANESGFMIGSDNTGAVVNSSLQVTFRASDDRITLEERRGGAWVVVDSTTSYDPEDEHDWLIIRLGAFAKVYLDDVLILSGPLLVAACTEPYLDIYTTGTAVLKLDFIRIKHVFGQGYAYLGNTGLTTATQGDIFRAQASGQENFELNLTIWEAFEEATADGEWFVKLHYDNGVSGTSWIGLQCSWTNATSTKTLTLYHDSGTSKEIDFPDDPRIVKGYTEHKYNIWCDVDAANNITDVIVSDIRDGITLGEYEGISEPLGVNLRLECEAETSDGCESPYFGRLQINEYPSQSIDRVEVPVCHHEVRYIKPVDDEGFYQIMAMPTTYKLWGISEYDSVGVAHVTETETSREDIFKEVLAESGEAYWRWFHYWNFNVEVDGANWLKHRRRGWSYGKTFNFCLQTIGAHMYATPEMQMLIDKYYRDFHKAAGDADSDPLELGLDRRQGIYWNLTNASDYSLTQTNWVVKVDRPDDAQIEKRMQDLTIQPASFQDPFKGGAAGTGIDQVYQSTAAVHANPTPTDQTPVKQTGNFTNQYGMSGPDIIQATIGALGPPANAVDDPTNMLEDWADNELESFSHQNQLLRVTLFGSKQWYRPMDIIELKVGTLDPTLMDVTTNLYDYKYVVHSAMHICHANVVEYKCGRIETEDDQGTDVVVVSGWGDIRDPGDKMKELKHDADQAMTQSFQ